MEEQALQHFAARLAAEKERITAQIEGIDGTGLAEALRDSVSELSGYDNHPADLGSETFERSKDLALKDNAAGILAQIEAAQDLIEAGEYGRCQRCGQEVGHERLEAIPYTTLCIECQKVAESGPHPARPVEEAVLTPPFGRTFLDRADYTGFDGEDAWQAVAQYGTAESPQDVPGAVSFDAMYVDGDEARGYVDAVEQYGQDGFGEETKEGADPTVQRALGEKEGQRGSGR